MTPQQYNERLSQLTDDTANRIREREYFVASNRLLATIKNRIQREGKDSSGSVMPDYSTKPAYFSKDAFVKKGSFKPKGKSETGKFKNGNTRRSMFIDTGYKGLKEVQGMDTKVRTINYSGSTMLSYVIGTTDEAILLGFDRQKASIIRKAQEDKNNGAIFSGTQEELAEFNKSIVDAEKEIVLQIFR